MSFDSNNSNPKVLAVDDECLNIEILEEILADIFNLVTVKSAEECFAEIEQCMPDIILLDVFMPGMNGLDACVQLKENPNTRHIPVIFVTSFGRKEERERGYSVGGTGYVSKPFKEDELVQTINDVLAGRANT